jgi:hypothetical protein
MSKTIKAQPQAQTLERPAKYKQPPAPETATTIAAAKKSAKGKSGKRK